MRKTATQLLGNEKCLKQRVRIEVRKSVFEIVLYRKSGLGTEDDYSDVRNGTEDLVLSGRDEGCCIQSKRAYLGP